MRNISEGGVILAEFLSKLVKNPKDKEGYTFTALHELYGIYSLTFYPDASIVGEENCRRNLKALDFPSYSASRNRKIYQVKLPENITDSYPELKQVSEEYLFSGTKENKLVQAKSAIPITNASLNEKQMYQESVRILDGKYARGSIDSIQQFIIDKDYTRVFGKDEAMEFKKFYCEYMKYCEPKKYVPVHRNTFKKYFEDMTYKIFKKGDSNTLYIDINSKNAPEKAAKPKVKKEEKPKVVEPIKLNLEEPVKVFRFEFKPIIKPEVSNDRLQEIDRFVREEFIRKHTNYSEGEPSYDTKKLYASFKYYTKNTDISFNQFRYVISHIPAARLDTGAEKTYEFSSIIPEYLYLENMHNKHVENGLALTISNYEKRVVKTKTEIIKIYEDLKENNGFDDPVVPVVEEKKEEEVKAEEPVQEKIDVPAVETTPAHNIEKAIKSKVEVLNKTLYETDEKAFASVDQAMQSIENSYSCVIKKYKTLEEIKQVIKEERIRVHAELKPIFDMLVSNSITRLKALNPTSPSFQKEVDELKASLRNLSTFVKNE